MLKGIIHDCDSLTGIHSEGITGLKTQQRELDDGQASTYLTGTSAGGGNVSLISHTLNTPIDISKHNMKEITLYFEFYIEDITALTSIGQVEITSGGNSDSMELGWLSTNLVIKNGWNQLYLKLSSGVSTGGKIDLSKINYFRFYLFTSRPTVLGYDNIKLLTLKPLELNESFISSSALSKWQAENADISAGQDGLTVNAGTGNARLYSQDYTMSVLSPSQANLYITLKSADTSKFDGLKIVLSNSALGKGAEYAISAAQIKAQYNTFKFRLDGFSFKDSAFNFMDTDKITINIEGSQNSTITISNIKLSYLYESIIDKINTIGEINFDNYSDKKSVVNEVTASIAEFYTEYKIRESYITDYITNYFKYLDALSEVAMYTNAQESGLLAELIASDVRVKTGDSFKVSLNLTNLKDSSLNNLRYEFTYSQLFAQTADNLSGTVSLRADANRTLDLYFIAQEGGLCFINLTVTSSSGSILTQQALRVYIEGKGFYYGDMHNHSTESDGQYTLAMNFYYAYKYGMMLNYATDHNVNTDNTEDVDYAMWIMEQNGYTDFLSLKGNEITVYGNNGHMLQYNSQTYYFPPAGRTELDIKVWQKIINDIIAEGGYCYFAHPFNYWYNYPGFANDATVSSQSEWKKEMVEYYPDAIDVYKGMTGVEIINALTTSLNEMHLAVEYWDRMNIKGEQKYFGIANSDAHAKKSMALGYNAFNIEGITENELHNSLGNGSFYATTGPELRFNINSADMGQSLIIDGDSASVKLNIKAFYQKDKIKDIILYQYTINPQDNSTAYDDRVITSIYHDDTGTNLFENTLTIDVAKGQFLRLEVLTGTESIRAYSNPIWITGAASTLTLHQPVLEINAGDKVMLKFDTDNIYDSVSFTSSDDGISVLDNGLIKVGSDVSDGIYVVTARSSSGKTAVCIVKIGDAQGIAQPSPSVPGTGNIFGCGGNISHTVLGITVAIVAMGIIFIYAKRETRYKQHS